MKKRRNIYIHRQINEITPLYSAGTAMKQHNKAITRPPARWTTRSGEFKMHCEKSKSGLVYFPASESSLVCIMDLILLANYSTTAKSHLKFACLIKLVLNA